MLAHAADFRSEVEREGRDGAARLEQDLLEDWRAADLDEADRALCAYAEKLTLDMRHMEEADVEALRTAGFSDPAIHDATQVVGYFNYITRMAEGLHVDLEPGMPPRPGDGA